MAESKRRARVGPLTSPGRVAQAIDTTTPTGRLMFNMLGAIAQFERELIRERMLVGIAKAKAEGKYKGRAPTARAKADRVKHSVLPALVPPRSRVNSRSAARRCTGY